MNLDAKQTVLDEIESIAKRLVETESELEGAKADLLRCEIVRRVAPEVEILGTTNNQRMALLGDVTDLLLRRDTLKQAQDRLQELIERWALSDTRNQMASIVAWVDDHATIK